MAFPPRRHHDDSVSYLIIKVIYGIIWKNRVKRGTMIGLLKMHKLKKHGDYSQNWWRNGRGVVKMSLAIGLLGVSKRSPQREVIAKKYGSLFHEEDSSVT